MTLDEYRASTDTNAYWRLSEGERQNLLDDACERLGAQAAELAMLRNVAGLVLAGREGAARQRASEWRKLWERKG